jgi:glucose/arabinose dehydrogenase
VTHHPGRIAALATVLVSLVVGACSPAPSGSPASSSTAAGPSASASPSSRPIATPRPSAPPADVGIEVVADGLVAPVGLVVAPGETDRAFVIDQTGLISILRHGAILPEPFLDIRDKVVELRPDYDERGLLGLAFHPDFAENGRVFVYYGAPSRAASPALTDHTNILSEFHVSAASADRADPASERVVLQFDQPQFNHSGGALGFGPDGYLYLGAGDGGGQGDASEGHSPQGNAQDTSKLNGKVLRLDVDGPEPFAIPGDNPFVGGGGRPEIYAYGFRNPWRLSWEPGGQKRLLVSDVGYGRWEEIDDVVKGGNYGWRIREGAHCLDVDAPLTDPTDCDRVGADGKPLVDPVAEYSHRAVGVAVVGGYRYRGSALPALRDQYVFADFSADPTNDLSAPRGSLLVATPSETAGETWPWRPLRVAGGVLGRFVTGMGEDAAGELYVLGRQNLGPRGTTGEVLKLVPPGP